MTRYLYSQPAVVMTEISFYVENVCSVHGLHATNRGSLALEEVSTGTDLVIHTCLFDFVFASPSLSYRRPKIADVISIQALAQTVFRREVAE
jgi:hypothetical protein